MSIDANAIPTELRERAQWVVWKRERHGDKSTKVPYRVDARAKAASDDPRTWATFEQALAAPAHAIQGVGYVFSADDPFTGVDLDACIDADGELHPRACEILAQLGGYQERSPSGKGMHAIIAAKLGGDRHKTGKTPWGGGFEVYDKRRFFTVTGNGGGEIVERQAQLDAVVAQMFPEASQNGAGPTGESANSAAGRSVDELVGRYPKLARLANREGPAPGDRSDSAWDFAMCCEAMREPRSCTDTEVDGLLRYARRGDPKGDRDGYIHRTIANARSEVGGNRVRSAPPKMTPAVLMSAAWGIADTDPVVSGWMIGEGRDAIVKLRRRSGEIMRIERLGLLFDKAAHNREMSIVARSLFTALKPDQVHDIAQAVIGLCAPKPMSDAEEGADLLYGVLGELSAVVHGPMDEGDEKRWETLVNRGSVEHGLRSKRGGDRAAVGIRDEHGRAWLPASAVRAAAGFPTWGTVNALVSEAGWSVERIQMWKPDTPHDQRTPDKHIRRVFYREPQAQK